MLVLEVMAMLRRGGQRVFLARGWSHDGDNWDQLGDLFFLCSGPTSSKIYFLVPEWGKLSSRGALPCDLFWLYWTDCLADMEKGQNPW